MTILRVHVHHKAWNRSSTFVGGPLTMTSPAKAIAVLMILRASFPGTQLEKQCLKLLDINVLQQFPDLVSTRDLDMVTNLTMAQIWSLIEGDARLTIPAPKIAADVIKIFIKTGPGYDECKVRKNVEDDIALPGVKRTPRDIPNAAATVRGSRITLDGRVTNPVLSTLDVPFVLKGKMYRYSDRGYDRYLRDIIFLLETYGDHVTQGRQILKIEDIEAFLESEELEEDEKERYGKILGV
nr:hypothetical protein CFP56_16816 [Quercus suber]